MHLCFNQEVVLTFWILLLCYSITVPLTWTWVLNTKEKRGREKNVIKDLLFPDVVCIIFLNIQINFVIDKCILKQRILTLSSLMSRIHSFIHSINHETSNIYGGWIAPSTVVAKTNSTGVPSGTLQCSHCREKGVCQVPGQGARDACGGDLHPVWVRPPWERQLLRLILKVTEKIARKRSQMVVGRGGLDRML